MSAAALIAELDLAGVRVWVDGDVLRYAGPPVSPELADRVRACRAQIIERLTTRRGVATRVTVRSPLAVAPNGVKNHSHGPGPAIRGPASPVLPRNRAAGPAISWGELRPFIDWAKARNAVARSRGVGLHV